MAGTSAPASPLVSVLTPSFEQGRWLGDNLRSVAAQIYPHIEHIVMDGRSTDESLSVLEQAGAHVRWRSEPDRGQAHAINKALAESTGAIIGWLNSDDAYFSRDSVARAVRVFADRPEIDVVYGHAAAVDADGKVLNVLWLPPARRWLNRWGNFIIQPAAFVRRSALEEQLVDESLDFSIDREAWLRLDERQRRFFRLDALLAIDRYHPARKSLTRPDLAQADLKRLVERYGVPRGGRLDSYRYKACRVLFRLMGLRMIGRVHRDALAFNARLDGNLRLTYRQLFARTRV